MSNGWFFIDIRFRILAVPEEDIISSLGDSDRLPLGYAVANPTYHGLSDRPPLGMKMVSGWSKTKEPSLKRGRSRLEA
jgi:hypothetical protein